MTYRGYEEYHRAYYERNKDKINIQRKDQAKQQAKKYYYEHKEEIAAKRKAKRDAKKESLKSLLEAVEELYIKGLISFINYKLFLGITKQYRQK